MILVEIIVGVAGCLIGALTLYLVLLAVASCFYKQTLDEFRPSLRLVVVVPSHNEVSGIAGTVRSLLAQHYPRELFRVCVIADNCTDGTAGAARAAGADEVMVRDVPELRGKGYALRWAMDQILDRPAAPDAIVSVDADTIADPDVLLALVERLESGVPAAQADNRTMLDDAGPSALRGIGFILMNRTRSAGRNVLGQSAGLLGNGWALSTELLRRRPWDAFTGTEDREYTIGLHEDDEYVAFAGAAAVRSPNAPNRAAEALREQRWEGGWATLARRQIPRLLRGSVTRRAPRLLGACVDLAVPPLGLLAFLSLVGLVLAVAFAVILGASPLVIVPWAVAVIGVPLYVLIGLVAARAPASLYRALAYAPVFVLRKPLRLYRTLRSRGDVWVRTERAGNAESK